VSAVTAPPDPLAILRTRSYVVLLVLAGILGVPISAVAYWFQDLVAHLQKWTFTDLPKGLGFHAEPTWWPLPLLAVAGVLVGLTIRYLPGRGGESPAEGFKPRGAPSPVELPGIALAALTTLALGAVLGPEAPLIALGGGLALFALRLVKRDAPPTTAAVLGAAGSFAAIAALFGSPLAAAFLLMEASGLGGATLIVVLLPGLLAAGIGSLIFTGLDSWTGHGTFSLAIPNLPPFARPNIAEFGWALVIAVAAALLGSAIRWLAVLLRPHVERRLLLLTPAVGLVVAGLAIVFFEATGKSSSLVLFSGQSALPSFLTQSATYSVGTLILLLGCKGLAYGGSLSSFRGGPTFPALFLGAAGGVALSHLPGLPMVPAVAVGIGAMCVVMLRLPLTSVLLATLLLSSDGLAVMPLVIVAVVVAYVVSARLAPAPAPTPGPSGPTEPAAAAAPETTAVEPTVNVGLRPRPG
jgi:H+/Cl- antiporter ClcA